MIVKAKERHIQNAEHVKGGVRLGAGQIHRVGREPRALERLPAKGIVPLPDKVVPIANGKAQMIGHRLVAQLFRRVVMAICQRIGAVCPFKGHGGDVCEILAHCMFSRL